MDLATLRLANGHLVSPSPGVVSSSSSSSSSNGSRLVRPSPMAFNSPTCVLNTSEGSHSVPRMEPFNRSRLSRFLREPSLLEKAEHAIADRCSTLEGDEAYNCWEAWFELEKLKHEYMEELHSSDGEKRATAQHQLDRLENLVRQSGGVAQLVNNLRMLGKARQIRETARLKEEAQKHSQDKHKEVDSKGRELHFFPEPDCLPPTDEDLEIQKSARMPESQFTSVLRRVGRQHHSSLLDHL